MVRPLCAVVLCHPSVGDVGSDLVLLRPDGVLAVPMIQYGRCVHFCVHVWGGVWATKLHSPSDARVLTRRQAIRAAYDELHAAGVVHNDLNLCNILVSGGSRLSLVDFESALQTGDAEFDTALKAEQEHLQQVA